METYIRDTKTNIYTHTPVLKLTFDRDRDLSNPVRIAYKSAQNIWMDNHDKLNSPILTDTHSFTRLLTHSIVIHLMNKCSTITVSLKTV